MCELADGHCDIHRNDLRKAIKDHKCFACDEPIRKGDKYYNGASLFDGSWTWWKRCQRCEAMFDHIQGETEDLLAIDARLACGETWESVFGCKPPEHVAALAFWLPGEPIPGAVRWELQEKAKQSDLGEER